jgi:hypothetical protein
VKAGDRYRSAVCTTEVIVVKAPSGESTLECGGAPMTGPGESVTGEPVIDPALSDGTQLGKRYVDEAGELEVLCTKAGAGTLAMAGKVLTLRTAKPLPSSD